MSAETFLPWIPVFPLLGFLVNGLLYLVAHSKLGGKDAPLGAHGRRRARCRARRLPRGARRPRRRPRRPRGPPRHPVQGRPHLGRSDRLRALVRLRPPRDRLLVDRDARPPPDRRDPLDLDPDGDERRLVRQPRLLRRRRLPDRPALGPDARLRDVHRDPDPRLLGRVHGARRGVREVLRLPEPLHVRDADARPRGEPGDPLRRVGRRRPLLLPPHRLLLHEGLRRRRRQEGVRHEPDRRRRVPDGPLRLRRDVRDGRLREDVRGGRRRTRRSTPPAG